MKLRILILIGALCYLFVPARGQNYNCSMSGNVLKITGSGNIAASSSGYKWSTYKNASSVEIEGVRNVPDMAFQGWTNLTSVTLGSSVTSVGRMAFNGCSSLSNVSFSEGLSEIGMHAFSGCKRLTSIKLPASLNKIGSSAFSECTALTTISTKGSISSVGNFAFSGCTNLQKVVCENAESWNSTAFERCPHIKISKGMALNQDAAKRYVEGKIAVWQVKDEFETTPEYRARVNETTRNQKAKEYYDEYCKSYLAEATVDLTLGQFDADNKTFLISDANCGDLLLYIPSIPEAKSFKANWSRVTTKPEFFVNNGKIDIKKIDFRTPDGKTYTYTNDNALTYAQQDIDYNFAPIDISEISSGEDVAQKNQIIERKSVTIGSSDVDINIKSNNAENKSTFVLIVANEKYKYVSDVQYAQNDGKIFKEYCTKTLGIPEKNVHLRNNATKNDIIYELNLFGDIRKAYGSNCNMIVYYAGHGIPDESSSDSYLLPCDGVGNDFRTGLKLSKLYEDLANLGVNNITIFLDACFSGAQRGEGMLASNRSVGIKVKQVAPVGNMVVFSAAQGDETAWPYKEKGHGMFTYFLLKKIQESNGQATLGELADYIQTYVKRTSVSENGKIQTPLVTSSANIADTWRNIRLR